MFMFGRNTTLLSSMLVLCIAWLSGNSALSQNDTSTIWKSRGDIAASPHVKYVDTGAQHRIADAALAIALGLDPATVQVNHNFGLTAQVGIFNQLGILVPTQGNSFVLMSSGVAGAGTGGLASPQPGIDFGTAEGGKNDLARMQIGPMTVPANQHSVRMDFVFLSAEYPEYVGSVFNDEFDILIYGSSRVPDGTNIASDAVGNPVNINSVTFTLNEYQVPGTGFEGVGGATGLLTASGLVNPGDNITLVLEVYDISDHIYDSAVLLDNVRFSTQGGGGIIGTIGLTPSSLAMLPGNTANVIVSLSNLAPAGGLTVHLSSTLPSIATVSPQTVFVPEGSNQGTTPATVTAVGLGVASVVATGTDFENGTAAVRVGTDLFVFENDISIGPQGNSYLITAVIHNQGLSTNSIEVKFLEQNLENNVQRQIGSAEIIANLGGNNQATLFKPYDPSSASTMVIVVVDPRGLIPESNEQNNSAAVRFTTERPTVQGVTAQFDRDPDPNVFGRFIHGLSNTQNTFFVTASGDVQKVRFSLGGTVVEDANNSNGWSATFDMGELPAGNNVLTVTAISPAGINSDPVSRIVRVTELPVWITANLTLWDIVRVDVSQSHLSFGLKFNVPGSAHGGPFSYIARINNDVMFIPHDAIEAESELELNVGIPLDATLGWQISGTLSLSQSVLGFDVGSREISLAVVLNADYSLNSILASFETEALLFGVEVKQYYPLVPGINAIIGGGFDVFGHLRLQMVAGMVNNHVRFVVAPNGEVTEIRPGLGLRFNLIGGLEIFFGLVSGELIISPRFDVDLHLQYVSPPLGTGFRLTTSGEGSVGWRVVGSVFWGWLEQEIASGVFGPWPIFGPDRLIGGHSSLRIDTVQLPSSLPLPCISTDSSGHVMIAWLQKGVDPDSPPQVYYSLKEDSGEFSAPQSLVSNDRYKSDPRVIFNPDGSASAVFVQNSQPKGFEQGHSLAEILRYQDIYYTRLNGGSWLAPSLVSTEVAGFERSDGVPTIAVSRDGSERLILWTRNVLENSLDRHGLEIFFSRGVNDIFQPPTLLSTGNTASDLMVRACYYSNSAAVAIWVRDLDSDPTTVDDGEVYYSRWQAGVWSTPNAITSNSDFEKDLSLVALRDGRIVAAWVQIAFLPDSTMQYSLVSSTYSPVTDTWSVPETVYTHQHFIETPSVQVDRRDIVTITWRGYHRNINGDILITAKDFSVPGAQWTTTRAITDDILIDWMLATAIDASNNQYFVNLKSTTSDSLMADISPSRRSNFFGGLSLAAKGIKPNGIVSDDLNIGMYMLAADLSVDSTQIMVVDSVLRVGDSSQVAIRITNIGPIESDTTRIRVYDNLPTQGGLVIVEDQLVPRLKPDSAYTLQFTCQFMDSTAFFISVDPDNRLKEQTKLNNSAFRRFVLQADVSVLDLANTFTGVPRVGEWGTVTALLKNVGSKNAQNVLLRFSSNSIDSIQSSTIFYETNLPQMDCDTLYTVDIPYMVDQTGTTYVFLIVDPLSSIPEYSKSNNTGRSLFHVLPDLMIDSVWYEEGPKRLAAVVRNAGGDSASEFSVHFFRGNPLDGGVLLDSLTRPAILVDETDTVSTLRNVPAGLQYLYVWVDKGNTISELNKANNLSYVGVVSPGSVDLTAAIVGIDSAVSTGQPAHVYFAVKNAGTSGCNSIHYNVFDTNNVLMKSGFISILNPGESSVDTAWAMIHDSLMSSIKIVVDPDNLIIESDETNNIVIGLVGGFPVDSGWNIISLPVETTDSSVAVLFPAAASNAYGYSDGYFIATHLHPGKGYWLKFNTERMYSVFGLEAPSTSISVVAGWNMIGPLTTHVPVSAITTTPPGIIVTPFFGFDSGYAPATTLQSRRGYWVKTNQAGLLNMQPGSYAARGKVGDSYQLDPRWTTLQLKSTGSKEARLYLASSREISDHFELPPTPPTGVFDVRFSTDRLVEELEKEKLLVRVRSAQGPLRITMMNGHGTILRIADALGGQLFCDTLTDGKQMVIHAPYDAISLEVLHTPNLIPTDFSLQQNYPNPFNPVTTIRFGLPEPANVTLTVFGILGEKICDLVQEAKDAGYHDVIFDARSYASGVYFYKIQAGKYTAIRKMLVVK